MADEPARREVLVKFWEHPVLRTEEEIAELKAAHLLREQGPVPGVRGTPAPPQPESPAGAQPQAPAVQPAPQPADKSKEQK